MKKILAPIDFSECSINALKTAASLARKTNGKLMIMHIINMPLSEQDNSTESYHAIPEGMFMIKLVDKKFKSLLKADYLQDLDLETIVAYNTVYETIAEKGKEYGVDRRRPRHRPHILQRSRCT